MKIILRTRSTNTDTNTTKLPRRTTDSQTTPTTTTPTVKPTTRPPNKPTPNYTTPTTTSKEAKPKRTGRVATPNNRIQGPCTIGCLHSASGKICVIYWRSIPQGHYWWGFPPGSSLCHAQYQRGSNKCNKHGHDPPPTSILGPIIHNTTHSDIANPQTTTRRTTTWLNLSVMVGHVQKQKQERLHVTVPRELANTLTRTTLATATALVSRESDYRHCSGDLLDLYAAAEGWKGRDHVFARRLPEIAHSHLMLLSSNSSKGPITFVGSVQQKQNSSSQGPHNNHGTINTSTCRNNSYHLRTPATTKTYDNNATNAHHNHSNEKAHQPAAAATAEPTAHPPTSSPRPLYHHNPKTPPPPLDHQAAQRPHPLQRRTS